MTLRIAVPNKGRLCDGALDLLRRIGLRLPGSLGRSLIAATPDGRYRVLFVRAGDIPEYIELGAADLGITGRDLVEETACAVKILTSLDFGSCRLVVAAPETSAVREVAHLAEGARIATAHPATAKRYFEGLKKRVTVVPVGGATEIAPYIGIADAIVDLTETGDTLKKNHLVEVATIAASTAVLVAPEKRNGHPGQDELLAAVQSVQAAARKRYLMANVPRAALDEVRRILPGISGPTVMPLLAMAGDWVAIHAVTSEDEINGVIPRLKGLGATGILVLPIERMVR